MDVKKVVNLYPLVRSSLCLIVGIIIGDAAEGRVAEGVWLALLGLTLGLALLAYRLRGHRRATTQSLLIMVTTLLLGATLVSHAEKRLRWTTSGRPQSYEAVVVSEPQTRGKVARMDLLITAIDGRPLQRPLSVKASLLRDTLTARWQRLHVGSGIKAKSILDNLKNYQGGHHFDYVRWLHVHGYRAQTFIFYKDWQPAPAHRSRLSLWQRVRLRTMMARQSLLARYCDLGFDGQQLALIAAMTLGDKSALSPSTKDDYSISGASHVLALSGLHLGIIYGLLTLLLGRVHRRQWVCQALVLAAVWMYVVLVGMPVSALRSATMLSVCALCLLLQRRRLSVNTLALAAIVLLVANPVSLWDVGFQLSFMAVLSIHLYTRPFYNLVRPHCQPLKWIWGMVCVSLATQIGTFPLVMFYFGRFACYSLLTNFIVIPAATVILYGALLMVVLTPIAILQKGVATGLLWVVSLQNDAVREMATWPGASIEDIRISLPQVILIYVVLAALTIIARRLWHLRRLRYLDGFHKHVVDAKDMPPVEIFDLEG